MDAFKKKLALRDNRLQKEGIEMIMLIIKTKQKNRMDVIAELRL